MSTITREQLRERAREKVKSLEFAVTQTSFADSRADLEEELELARIALASLEAKPIGAFHIADQQVDGNTDYIKDGEWPIDDGVIEVYAAPPAPVSMKDHQIRELVNELRDIAVEYHGTQQLRERIARTVRNAMLQGADRPQNVPQNIPENIPVTQFKSVADLYGLTSPTGSETSFTFDAVEARDFIDGGWSCQEYVELERFQDAMSSNSPVIPDGWVIVPEEPTHEMLEADDEQFGTYDVYRRMIAAAPQQEVK
ncbi:hypothetical protein [unidentified bacterial endosymbiont]|uniref:hypothetical protein n=1 Tax=unidentified bacterial endosymbiont TaxID=2355 RepID=UPI0020A13E87|nr:hypothetical protein [unidentified bacterial endosymbiont]